MITTLHIKNIGIIDEMSIDLNEGFNVLTGETGAGKTLIIDSLGIIAGGRFSKEMIRKGENYSYVELCFYAPENEQAMDGNIIVSREIYANGRNLCKINDRMVTVSALKEFMKTMLDIHGQHDNQFLLDPTTHIRYLDNFVGSEMKARKQEYQALYQEWKSIKTELKQNYGDEKEKERRLDLLEYQLKEIQEAELTVGEEEKLETARRKIENNEKIQNALGIAHEQIEMQGIDAISTSIHALEKICGVEEEIETILNNLKSMYYDLQEMGRDIGSLKEQNEEAGENKQEIEDRLDLIYSLKRKYGNTIPEILEYGKKVEAEIEKITNMDGYIKTLKGKKQKLKVQMEAISKNMHDLRENKAKELSVSIDKELSELEMQNSKFQVRIEYNTQKEFGPDGLDRVEFFISTNIGEEAKPLHKIASGGEMSRMMLAIKTILANADEIPTLVFDEIDTGISGKAARAVAEKMKRIAKTHQVICVTHLAVIAAKSDYHYYINKEVVCHHTKSKVKLLKESEVIEEIARLASGENTPIALEHAKQLRAS